MEDRTGTRRNGGVNIFSRGHRITNESGTSETRQTQHGNSWSSYVLLRPPSFRPYGHGILERPSRICRKYLYSLNMKPSRFPPIINWGQQSLLSPHGVSFVSVQARYRPHRWRSFSLLEQGRRDSAWTLCHMHSAVPSGEARILSWA